MKTLIDCIASLHCSNLKIGFRILRSTIGARNLVSRNSGTKHGLLEVELARLGCLFLLEANFAEQPNLKISFLYQDHEFWSKFVSKIVVPTKHSKYFVNSSYSFSRPLLKASLGSANTWLTWNFKKS